MKHLLRFVSSLLALGFTGCASLYFPPPPHAPLLTHKGEFVGGISTNLQNNFALQGAYAVGEHVAAAATFSSLHRSKSKRTEDIDFGEASAGYFTRLPDQRVLEVYVGAGGGRTQRIERDDNEVTTQTLKGNLTKYFAQVNYAKKKQESIHLFKRDFPISYGAAMRLSYVELSNFHINNQLQSPADNLFFEPITFTRVQVAGPVQLQLMSGQIFGFRQNKYLKAANSVFQVGIILNLGDVTTANPAD
jgi:hypothetical protein